MHDDGEPASERNAGLSQPTSLGDLECPGLQREALAGARQDRVGRLVEELADCAVTLLGDATCPIELARLVPSGNEPEVGARCSLSLEPARLVDSGRERSGGLHAHARDAHQGLAGRRGYADHFELTIQLPDPVNKTFAGAEQTYESSCNLWLLPQAGCAAHLLVVGPEGRKQP